MTITTEAAQVYRDKNDGLRWNPKKNEIRDLFSMVDSQKVGTLFAPDPEGDAFRLVIEKIRETVSAADAEGFELDSEDDQSPFLVVADSLRAERGGVVMLPAGLIRISSDLNLAPYTTFRGAQPVLGENYEDRSYNGKGTVIWMDPGVKITLGNCSGLEDVVILNSDLTYPVLVEGVPNLTQAEAIAQVGDFAGTAIRIQGDDCTLLNLLIIGFEYAVISDAYDDPIPGLPEGPSRLRADNVWFDCTNGFDISASYDNVRIKNTHGWGFFVGHLGYNWPAVIRNGTAYHLHDHVDGAQLRGCFSLGWTTNYHIKDVFGASLTQCTCDGVPVADMPTNGIGFLTEGTCNGVEFDSCRADGNWRNWVFNHTLGGVTGNPASGISGRYAFEFGPSSYGVLSYLLLAASFQGRILVKSGVGQWGWGAILGYYMISNGFGNLLVEYENVADVKKIQRGPAIIDDWTYVSDAYGPSWRSGRFGTNLANGVRIDGAYADGSGQPHSGFVPVFAQGDDASVGIDIGAQGRGAASQVRFFRKSVTDRELFGRITATVDQQNASFLIDCSNTNQVQFGVEGAASNINAVISPKGTGLAVLNGPCYFVNGTGANNPFVPGGITFEYASNTSLRIKMMGSDMVVRFATLTLS